MTRLRIKRIKRRHSRLRLWRKIGLSAIAAAVTVGICSLVYCIDNTGTVEYGTYTVSSGDTLWSIAENAADNSVDVRDVIYLIEQMNDIENSVVHKGESLIVPVYGRK